MAPCQHCTSIHIQGTYIPLKNLTTGQGRWKLDGRYSELVWKLVSIYSFIISVLSERLGKFLWPHDSHRVHCGGHHLSRAFTGCYSIKWYQLHTDSVNFISQNPLALGLLLIQVCCTVKWGKTFCCSLCFSIKHLTHFCPNWMLLCLKLLHSSVLLDSKDFTRCQNCPPFLPFVLTSELLLFLKNFFYCVIWWGGKRWIQ